MASVGEPEASDDSISLTSTVSSAEAERYEVECILAERDSNGFMEYLTAWKNYPEHRHSWEPRDCFFEDEVFSEWTRTQMRIDRGLAKPFDIKAWKKRCKEIHKKTSLRKERRRDKKLRLSNRLDESILGPGGQDANIESSGSEPGPRRSDKRIKRRSVHQDQPPSSSSADTSFSSSSEDSDRPLTSRQGSEIFIQNVKWTQAETIALEEGLRTLKGPHWKELLGLYGRNGTISQALKYRTSSNLFDKAKSVRQEFVDSGREPPEYLKPFSKTASSQGSGTATPNSYSESRVQSRAASKKTSRSTSADSMMAELREKQRIREAKTRKNSGPQQTVKSTEILNSAGGQEKESDSAKKMLGSKPKAPQASQAPARRVEGILAKSPLKETPKAVHTKSHPKDAVPHKKNTTEFEQSNKDNSLRERQSKDGPRTKESSRTTAIPQAERQSRSLTPNAKKTTRRVIDAAAQPESSRTNVLENNKPMPEGTVRTTWTGTARASTARSSASNPSRLGALGRGPTRLSSSKLKPKLRQIEPKKPSVTGDVTAAWNVEPKKRKSNNWATTNADSVDGQAPKRNRNYRLSVQNRIYKSRREGLAPDPDRLVFIDPKTGKAPTTVPAPSATAALSKTPLQLHQEELASREAEKCLPREAVDAMLVSRSEPDPPPRSIDQNHEIRVDEHVLAETDGSILNASASTLKPTAAEMTDRPAIIDTHSPAPPHPGPSRNVPFGPRIETKRMARMSLEDYTKRSMSSSRLPNEALINSHQPYSSDEPSTFTLRSYPSWEQKNEIFNKMDTNLVIGNIRLGKDDQESITVRLVGFGYELKKLLLTVKCFPRTVDFVFETVCLASEYQAYFPAVSPPC